MSSAVYDFFFTATGDLQRDVVVAGIFLAIGIGLTIAGSLTRQAWRLRKEAKENQKIDLSGDWFAAWEASVNQEIIINTESISISQWGSRVWMKNNERSPENPEGGYLWRGQLVFSHGETLMGWYFPLKKENITSRGIMFFSYDSQRKLFVGKWVGKSYDGSLCNGFVCISKDRERSREGLMKLIGMAKAHPVNILRGVPFSI